jgi:signal transduction histidine kinase
MQSRTKRDKAMHWTTLVIPFLRTSVNQLLTFLLINGIFAVLFLLASLDLNIYLYGLQLTLFFWLIILAVQWTLFMKRVRKAESIRFDQDLSTKRDKRIQSVDDLYESSYRSLYEEYMMVKQEMNEKNTEQMDYFTLWLHQIKTPISAMSLILQRHPDKKDSRILEQELIRINDYTHMALNYLKLEDTGKELDLQEVAVDDVIKSVLKKYAVMFIHKEISVEYEPSGKKVLSDRKWLQVLIEQLISNSLKYTMSGSVSIRLDGRDRLIVEDTGSGISQEDLPKIFEKGYTGLNGRLHDKSTGLGLFLSRKICKRLGHKLTIESELDKGTKALISFGANTWTLFD